VLNEARAIKLNVMKKLVLFVVGSLMMMSCGEKETTPLTLEQQMEVLTTRYDSVNDVLSPLYDELLIEMKKIELYSHPVNRFNDMQLLDEIFELENKEILSLRNELDRQYEELDSLINIQK
jgi:hypothetical protein